MKPIKQEDPLGCGVACVAFILKVSYSDTLKSFKQGEEKAKTIGFFCEDIIEVLNSKSKKYTYSKINNKIKKIIYQTGVIVFTRKSKKYPAGHYLCRVENLWMDPWINFPAKNKKAGFIKRLPEKPTHVIYPV